MLRLLPTYSSVPPSPRNRYTPGPSGRSSASSGGRCDGRRVSRNASVTAACITSTPRWLSIAAISAGSTRASPSARCRGHAREPEAFHQGVEVVACVLRIERARQLHGAQHRRGELHAEPAELRAQEAVVEACVVSDEQPPFEPAPHFLRHVGKRRRIRHHRVVDAGERAIDDGIRMPGCTSVLHSSTISPCSSSTMPTSMTRCCAAMPPVVSRSTQATGTAQRSAPAAQWRPRCQAWVQPGARPSSDRIG